MVARDVFLHFLAHAVVFSLFGGDQCPQALLLLLDDLDIVLQAGRHRTMLLLVDSLLLEHVAQLQVQGFHAGILGIQRGLQNPQLFFAILAQLVHIAIAFQQTLVIAGAIQMALLLLLLVLTIMEAEQTFLQLLGQK